MNRHERRRATAIGIRDLVVAHGSKHPQLRFKINGGPLHVFAVPGTPSDHRSPAKRAARPTQTVARRGRPATAGAETIITTKTPDRATWSSASPYWSKRWQRFLAP